MSSCNDEEIVSPHVQSSNNQTAPDYGISPMTTLSVNLGSALHIRRTLSFHSAEVSPKKYDVPGKFIGKHIFQLSLECVTLTRSVCFLKVVILMEQVLSVEMDNIGKQFAHFFS